MAVERLHTTIGALCDEGIADIQTGPFGSQLHAHEYVERGVPVVPTEAIRDRRIDHSVLPKVSTEKAAELSRHALREGDILFARRGVQATGQIGYVRQAEQGFLCGTGAIRLRVDAHSSAVSSAYLSHVFANPAAVQWFKFHAIGATMPNLNEGIIRAFPVALPPLREQHAIAHILGTLDDKIELNRRMSETLEAIARALYSSWFAQAAPVYVQAADLIREGVLEIGDGYRAKNSELGEPGLPFIRAGNLANGFETRSAEVLRHESVSKAGRKISQRGDVAFTSKGTIGRFARVTEYTQPFVYSPQICFWRSLNTERLQPAILYYWMQSVHFRSQVDAVAGQTDMAPYVSLRDQRKMKVPVFPHSQAALAKDLNTLLRRQSLADEERGALAAVRDALLPKLISGAVRVAGATITPGQTRS